MKLTKDKISLMFLILVIALFTVYGGFSSILIYKNHRTHNNIQHTNWQTVYPNIIHDTEPASSESKRRYLFSSFISTMNSISNAETWRNDTILGIGARINSYISNESIRTGKVRLNNGYWIQLRKAEDMQDIAASYTILSDYLENSGIPLLYIQTPYKEALTPQNMPWGIINDKNKNVDSFLNSIIESGINYVDLRTLLSDTNNPYSYFYKTDHHWNTVLACRSTYYIADILKKDYNLNINSEYKDINNYKLVTYKKAMFGGFGQEVGHINESAEDFYILYPKFKTSFHYYNPDVNMDVDGDFNDVMIDHTALNDAIIRGGGEVNEVLNHGNCSITEITNNDYPDGANILMIKDSYGSAMVPYLAIACHEIDMIDARSYGGNFNGSILSYIEKKQPDIVLVMHYYPELYTFR